MRTGAYIVHKYACIVNLCARCAFLTGTGLFPARPSKSRLLILWFLIAETSTSPFLTLHSSGPAECSIVDRSLPGEEYFHGICEPNPTWGDTKAGDPAPRHALNSASKRDAQRPRSAAPISVSDDDDIPTSQHQTPLALFRNSEEDDDCTSLDEVPADAVSAQSGSASDGTPPRLGVRRNPHGHDVDDPDDDFQNEEQLPRSRFADPKTTSSPAKKLTAAEKRKSAVHAAPVRRSERSLRSDATGSTSPRQEGREPFKSPQVLSGTTNCGKKKAGPRRPPKKLRNGKS